MLIKLSDVGTKREQRRLMMLEILYPYRSSLELDVELYQTSSQSSTTTPPVLRICKIINLPCSGARHPAVIQTRQQFPARLEYHLAWIDTLNFSLLSHYFSAQLLLGTKHLTTAGGCIH
jgi:hypothetical protein